MKFKKIAAAFTAALMIFACSVESAAYAAGGESGGSARTSVCEKFLEGTDLELYRMLLECMSWVADGRRNADTFYLTLSGSYANTIEYEKAIRKVIFFIDNYTPEYTYWTYRRGYAADDKSSCRIVFYISPAYRSLDNRIGKARLDDVNRALANAKEIVDRYDGKSDYDKIVGYAKEICALNEYNYAAADDDNYFAKNIDPWSIIYVFDGDRTTNVVCEGYGKAFQYLCDLGGIECHYVTGAIKKGGNHGWNIVVLDGKSYLVDLTMCDDFSEDVIERDHPFVLNSVVSSTPAGFSAHYSGDGGSLFVSYTYGEKEMEYLPDSLRTLSTKEYRGRPKLGAVIVIVLAAAGIAFYIIRKKKKKAKEQYIFFYN